MADHTGQTIGEYTLREPLDTDRYGMRYRATVLSQGRERSVDQLLELFLGRKTNANAFFEDLKR